jgi:hypothetical protein
VIQAEENRTSDGSLMALLHTFPPFVRVRRWATPARVAFLASLALSLLSVLSNPSLNRDGMLYIDSARMFLSDGLAGASTVYNWPFLPILIAGFSQLSGLDLQNAALLLNALFLAGACSLLVACATRSFPEAAWPICLCLLALPGMNQYRNEILREYGCWFFFMLSFWLALRWSERPQWSSALAVQMALIVAALFRPEAAVFYGALTLWQLFAAPAGQRWRRAAMIGGLPLAGLVVLVLLYHAGQLESIERLVYALSRGNREVFDAKANVLAQALVPYAHDQTRTILFFGSLFIIPVKFLKQLNLFVVPLSFALAAPSLRATLSRWQPLAWAFVMHCLVLAVFVLDLQFLAGRYAAVLQLLIAPLIGYGLWLMMQRFPGWRWLMILLAVLMTLSNVVSLKPGKQHFSKAGEWLAQNATDSPTVYIESARAAYYAGWRYSTRQHPQDRSLLRADLAHKKYNLVVLEISQGEAEIRLWLENLGLREIRRFNEDDGNADGKAILIAVPSADTAQGTIQDKAAKTENRREDTASTE